MHLELDLYWAWRGAADPVDLIRAHRGRVQQFHVKDMNIDSGFADLGTGLIDFRRIFDRAQTAAGIEGVHRRTRRRRRPTPASPRTRSTPRRSATEFLRNVRF